MEHNICKENLSAYLDNELPGEEKISLESHLAGCADCSRELAELKRVSTVFKEHAVQPVPLSLKAAVFAEKRGKPAFSHWFKPAAALAAAAAGLLIILALPKLREQRPGYSPELFQNAYYAQQIAQGASAGNSAEPKPAPVLPAASPAGAGGSLAGTFSQSYSGESATPAAAGGESPRYAAPSFNKGGARAQAKFAGAALSRAGGTLSASGASPAGASAGAGFFSGGSAQAVRGAAGKATGSPALPKWVEEVIQRYKRGPKGNPPLSVWEFTYKEKKVYYFPPQCCDQYSSLYDGKGALLCAPDGGRTGGGDGKCPDFYDLRKDGRQVWQDTRGGR